MYLVVCLKGKTEAQPLKLKVCVTLAVLVVCYLGKFLPLLISVDHVLGTAV